MDEREASESFLTVAEVAGILKLNQQTVRNWIDQGSLPALRVGRRVRIRRSDFERILAEGYTGGSASSSGAAGSGESGASGPPTTSTAPGAAGQGSAPTAEDFWGGEAVGLAPAMDNPAVGNGNSA